MLLLLLALELVLPSPSLHPMTPMAPIAIELVARRMCKELLEEMRMLCPVVEVFVSAALEGRDIPAARSAKLQHR